MATLLRSLISLIRLTVRNRGNQIMRKLDSQPYYFLRTYVRCTKRATYVALAPIIPTLFHKKTKIYQFSDTIHLVNRLVNVKDMISKILFACYKKVTYIKSARNEFAVISAMVFITIILITALSH